MKKLLYILFFFIPLVGFPSYRINFLFYQDNSSSLSFIGGPPVSTEDQIYNSFLNSDLIGLEFNSTGTLVFPSFTIASTNTSSSRSKDYPIKDTTTGQYLPLSRFPSLYNIYSTVANLYNSGFTNSSYVTSRFSSGITRTCINVKPLNYFIDALSSPNQKYRDTLLSSLSSLNNSVSSISSSMDYLSSSIENLQKSYSFNNPFNSGDYSSISNQFEVLSLTSFLPTSDSILYDLNYENLDPDFAPSFYPIQQKLSASALDSFYRFQGFGYAYHSMPGNSYLTDALNNFGQWFNKGVIDHLDNSAKRLGESFSNAFDYSFNTPSSNNVFQASLQGVFSNNWHLITNDHNVVNKALQNITNFIQGADLGQIHNSLSNIIDNTLPLPSVYRNEDKSLRVYVVNPSTPQYQPGEDPSFQVLDMIGGWIGDGGTNTWNLFAGNMLVDLEELLDLIRAFRYDFQQWTHDWDHYQDESLAHFNRHASYLSFITNFVADVLEPTMVMLKAPLEDYTNILSIANSRLAADYEMENVTPLGLTTSMLGHIPDTDSLLHDAQELTNVVDFSSRSLIEESLGFTNEVNAAVSLYYKDVSLPSNINLNIYRDISFSIPVAEQASLWTLLRNGLGFGLFIVNVLLFPKFLLHLLRLLFGAADSFYANQAKP